uniref:Reverse transcriptase domain-containing protein n=1 Tax=Tanacetum cinerariifolium TaxID=118510 RepID=A0A6L2K2E8_TANCI|nr:hypothetical protein [Tanacetum cinerariifolium]
MSEEVFQAKGNLMKSIQTFLEKFSRYPFGVMPKVLLQAWEKFFEIQHAQPEDTNELFQKLLEDLQHINEELTEYINSLSWNIHTFYDNDEEYSIQYKEYLEKSSDATTPVLPTEEPEYSLSMWYEHLSTIPKTKSDEVIESSAKNLVPIPNEYEVTSEDESEFDLPVCKDHSEILSDSNNDDISSDEDAFEDIEYVEASLPDSEFVSLKEENDVYQEEEEFDLEDILQIQDVILREKLSSINRLITDIESSNENPTPDHVFKSSTSFPIFEESDSSLSDNSSPEFETFSDHTKETRSGNTTTHANNSPPEYDSFCFEIEPDQERLTNVVMKDISDDSTNDPVLEEVDLFLASDNSIPPDVEICFDSEPSSEEVISDELNEDECFDQGGEIDVFANVKDDDYFPFIFVIQKFLPYLIYPEVSPLLLSARSEDTIFDPGISV